MSENIVESYGWSSSTGPDSCNYLAPRILSLLRKLNVNRVLDIGAGNGKLCSEILDAGYEIVGLEYDKEGVAIATESYPRIPFYNYGVQDNPESLLASEATFDAVVSSRGITPSGGTASNRMTPLRP